MKAFYEDRTYENELWVNIFSGSNFNFIAHWHKDIEILRVKRGSIKVGINNNITILNMGDIAVCGSNDIHFYDSSSNFGEVEILIFNPEIINQPSGWPAIKRFSTGVIAKSQNEMLSSIIEDEFEIVRRELKLRETHYHYIVKGSIYNICGILLRTLQTESIDENSNPSRYYYLNRMYEVINFIEENYKNQIRLEDAANIANLSPCHFSRIFKKTVGQNLTSYVNSIRVYKAEEMLKKNDKTISEIALECGFDSINTFNRVFKSIKKVTPSALR